MIIWLASYPKSGNTWLRLFLKSYFSKPESELNINKFATDNFKCDSFPNLSLLEKLNVDYLKFEEIVKNWSSMQNFINLHNKINYVKTHNALCTVGPFKFTDKSQTAGAVYLIRDPRDVAVSYSHHLGKSIDETINIMNAEFNFEFPDSKRGKFKSSLIGKWSVHYESWRTFNSGEVLVIKYEDMVNKTTETFSQILHYLSKIQGFKIDTKKLQYSIEQTNFQTLSNLEKKQGFREKGEGKFFFRKGEIGDWKRVLTKKQTHKIENAFSKEMVNLGYLKV